MFKVYTLLVVLFLMKLSSCSFGNKNGQDTVIVQNPYAGIKSIEAFGAIPDDGKDDLPAIQKSIDELGYAFVGIGTYQISSAIKANIHGAKMFGISEMLSIIEPLPSFNGEYLVDFGNGKTSKYANEVRYLKFDGAGKSNITAIRFNRVNNSSRIQYCYFGNLNKGIYFENLALANTISQNTFRRNVTNIELNGVAGNSTQIINNYFAKGRIHLNGSMTDVKIYGNTFDGDATLYSDGKSGVRGLFVSFNRFESVKGSYNISLGYGRKFFITQNYFTGNEKTPVAIEFRSNYQGDSKEMNQNHTIVFNAFERYKKAYVYTSIPQEYLNVRDNTDDGSALKSLKREKKNQNE